MQVYSLKEVLAGVNEDSCPYTMNFHCHTTYSDGSLSPIDLIKQATTLSLDHIAVTDHHSIESYNFMTKWLSENRNKYKKIPTLWSGIEITCLINKCLVHVLGLNINITSQYLIPYVQGHSTKGIHLQAKNVVKAIHNAGGLAFLAHPARYRLNYESLINECHLLGFDGIETWYNYEYTKPWKPSPLICSRINDQVVKLGLLSTCGTDTHGFNLTYR